MPGQTATVLTVWEPFIEVMTRAGAGMAYWPIGVDTDEIDTASEKNARQRAEEGVERAREAGLDAQPSTRARGATIAETIMAEAKQDGAKAIVLGTRGLTGVKSLVLGSVSHAVLQHADRPVVVVPSPEVAAARTARGD
jgi:nucleotide-binding universal stress UspA family protein